MVWMTFYEPSRTGTYQHGDGGPRLRACSGVHGSWAHGRGRAQGMWREWGERQGWVCPTLSLSPLPPPPLALPRSCAPPPCTPLPVRSRGAPSPCWQVPTHDAPPEAHSSPESGGPARSRRRGWLGKVIQTICFHAFPVIREKPIAIREKPGNALKQMVWMTFYEPSRTGTYQHGR